MVRANGAPLDAPVTVSTALSQNVTGIIGLALDGTATLVEIINSSSGTLWARWNADPAVNGVGSFPIVAGGSYSPPIYATGTLKLIGTNQPVTVHTWR